MPQRPVWAVSALLLAAGDALSARFGAIAVRGELSGFTRAASGHCYFNLKDADGSPALLRCAMFRRAATLLDFLPADGQRIDLRGRLAVYEPRGELQFVAETMQRVGSGSLYEEFLRLRERLQAAGLFDDARKRLPSRMPRRVGIVTSLQAAALHDVLSSLARRAPHLSVVVYPAPVQGAGGAGRACARAATGGRKGRGRHLAAGAGRWIAGGPVGLQRRARGARGGGLRVAGDLRRRPRNRRHTQRSGRRPAGPDAHRRR